MFDQFDIPLNISIRPCVEEDLHNFEWYGLFFDQREIFQRTFEKYQKGQMMMFAAEVNSYPVGRIWVDVMQKRWESVGIMQGLQVIPYLQNLGIGSHLIKVAEKFIKSQNLHVSEIGIDQTNYDARRLFDRLSYKVFDEQLERWEYTTPDGRKIHAAANKWLMRKNLNNAG